VRHGGCRLSQPCPSRNPSLHSNTHDAYSHPSNVIPELLTKPIRHGHEAESKSLIAILARLRLVPVNEKIAELAAGLGANYGLRAMDALHLACAVGARADAFVTNNRKDFSRESVLELEILHPEQLE
jgi:predicted nucleic acid-binding protein